jgi:hypothetical protein
MYRIHILFSGLYKFLISPFKSDVFSNAVSGISFIPPEEAAQQKIKTGNIK